MPRDEGIIGIDMPFEVGDWAIVNEEIGDIDITEEIELMLFTPPEGTRVQITHVQAENRKRKGFQTYDNDLIYFNYRDRKGEQRASNLWAWMLDFEERPCIVNDPAQYDCDLFEWGTRQVKA